MTRINYSQIVLALVRRHLQGDDINPDLAKVSLQERAQVGDLILRANNFTEKGKPKSSGQKGTDAYFQALFEASQISCPFRGASRRH